jgi:hypothetical protein
MAELTTMRNDVLGYPVYGLPYVVAFPILDEDGDIVTGLTPDTEISKNGDTAVDTATEAAEIAFDTATNKGMYQLQLSAAEMTANVVTITVYTGATTSQATPIVLYPKQLPLIASGVAGADGNDATHIDLHGLSAVNDFYNGCLVYLKDHTGAAQVRMITDYVGSTALATVAPAFATAPDNTTDYEVYLTDVAITTLIANNLIQIGGTAQTANDVGADTDAILLDTGTDGVVLKAAGLATDAVNEIVDQIYEELRADHGTAGTYGEVSTKAEVVTALLAGVIDGTGGNVITLAAALAQILSGASGNIAKTGDAYAFKDRDGATLFTLTMAASTRTRS